MRYGGHAMHTIQSSHRSVPGEVDVVVSWLLQRLAINLAELYIAYKTVGA